MQGRFGCLGANEDNKRAILQKITIDPPQPKKGSKFAIKCEIDLSESPV